MTIGVTGASGFIGRNLCDSLNKHYSIVQIDLKDSLLDNYDFSGIDVIVHLAGIAHKIKSSDIDIYFKVNRDLAYQTALKAKKEGVRHFIFMSTSKVYGDFSPVDKAFDETSKCNPLDAYAKSKYEAEMLITDLSDEFFKVAAGCRSDIRFGAILHSRNRIGRQTTTGTAQADFIADLPKNAQRDQMARILHGARPLP